MSIDKVRVYFDSPGFLAPFADGIIEALNAFRAADADISNVHVFFTTHSIPKEMGETSGPGMFQTTGGAYEAQHAPPTRRRWLARRGTHLVGVDYQSRSGPPQVPWLEPDINDALRSAKEQVSRPRLLSPWALFQITLKLFGTWTGKRPRPVKKSNCRCNGSERLGLIRDSYLALLTSSSSVLMESLPKLSVSWARGKFPVLQDVARICAPRSRM